MEQLLSLLQRYHAGTLSEEDRRELIRILDEEGMEEAVRQISLRLAGEELEPYMFGEGEAGRKLGAILEVVQAAVGDGDTARVRATAGELGDVRVRVGEEGGEPVAPVRVLAGRAWRVVAAAVIFLIVAIGAWWYLSRRNPAAAPIAKQQPQILPGSNKALLTLADGSTVTLDSAAIGRLASQPGAVVDKTDSGRLAYHTDKHSSQTDQHTDQTDKHSGTSGAVAYNTISTPRGGTYQVILPDGTRVWLNSASSIRFPVAFSGSERRVTITGEAYFEVAQHASQPFIVTADNRAAVEVLGTAFNLNAYDNEKSVEATLLTGKVKVSDPSPGQTQSAVLQPGQQARLTKKMELIAHANTEQVMAWKNGLFNFTNMPFEKAMRQLERWYDINVVYAHGVPGDIELDGGITRGVTLNDLLDILRRIGVKCTLEGKQLKIL